MRFEFLVVVGGEEKIASPAPLKEEKRLAGEVRHRAYISVGVSEKANGHGFFEKFAKFFGRKVSHKGHRDREWKIDDPRQQHSRASVGMAKRGCQVFGGEVNLLVEVYKNYLDSNGTPHEV